MAIYKVLFQPLEEYFFGEEGTFGKIGEIDYFLRSKEIPAQTTIFGMIRYMGLEIVKDYRGYTDGDKLKNKEAIGEKSFDIAYSIKDRNCCQEFGRIKAMSSIFIYEENIKERINKVYVSIPNDCKGNSKEYESILKNNQENINTNNDFKHIPKYDAKKGLCSGYINIDGGIDEEGNIKEYKNEIIKNEDIFLSVKRANINISKDSDQGCEASLFKKEYKKIKTYKDKTYYFGVYVEIDEKEDIIKEKFNRLAGLGLGKKIFKIKTEVVTDREKNIRLKGDLCLNVENIFKNHPFKDSLIYCISPTYIKSEVLEKCSFVSRKITTNRPMMLQNKSNVIYKFLDSGSILFVNNENKYEVLKEFNYLGLQKIGYNKYFFKGEESNEIKNV